MYDVFCTTWKIFFCSDCSITSSNGRLQHASKVAAFCFGLKSSSTAGGAQNITPITSAVMICLPTTYCRLLYAATNSTFQAQQFVIYRSKNQRQEIINTTTAAAEAARLHYCVIIVVRANTVCLALNRGGNGESFMMSFVFKSEI